MRDYGLSEEELVEKYGLPVFYDDWSMYEMSQKTTDQMIAELHQVVIGIPENPQENGMVGKMEDIDKHLRQLNGQVGTNTLFRKVGTWITCAMVTAILTLIVALFVKGVVF